MRCVVNCPVHARKVSKLKVKLASVKMKKACTERKENQLFHIKMMKKSMAVSEKKKSRGGHGFFIDLVRKIKLAKISTICYFIMACQFFNNQKKWRKTGYVEKEKK